MKRNLKISFVILILFAVLLPVTYSYAIAKTNQQGNSFFEITQLEVSPKEKVEMIVYFERINYDKFEFTLQSNSNMKNIEVSNDSANTYIEKNSNEITIEIDKSKTNINQLTLYYQVPETAQVNDVIKFTATVTNIQSDELIETSNTDETIIEPDTEEEDDTVITNVSETQKQTIEVQVKIVEKKEQPNKTEQKNDKQENENKTLDKREGEKQEINNKAPDNRENERQEINSKIQNNKNVSNVSNSQVIQPTNKSSSNSVTVTYNGSDNNYLKTLSVDGYSLNKEFSKDNSTYFVTVGNDITSLNINASVEESSATICIYGNEDLEKDTNKILISVTAENGNVRNYRIYVTKNA